MEAPLLTPSQNAGDAASTFDGRRRGKFFVSFALAACTGCLVAYYGLPSVPAFSSDVVRPSSVATRQRVFLHFADTHADPFYDYRYYFAPAAKIARSPALYSKSTPAEHCPWHTEGLVFEFWNKSGGGPKCPCGQVGANPPFSILEALRNEINKQKPEFVLIGGDFASHYEPGTAKGDECAAARSAAKATVSMISSRLSVDTQFLWAWGNNDVLPKREPLTQSWLEEFGGHLLEARWLKPEEMHTWNKGGFYRRNLGQGLCVITLNSNSWTENQINEIHHAAQLSWFENEAFQQDPTCTQFFINAHVPLGWLESGSGHHQWDNLKGAEATDYSEKYRQVLHQHSSKIIAELYGHINKADIRLMSGKHSPQEDEIGGSNHVKDGKGEDDIADIGDDIGGDASTVSFTVAGISRRGLNDPQFQRIYLDQVPSKNGGEWEYKMDNIEVFSMQGSDCSFGSRYNFRDVFSPHFDEGINVESLKSMVADKAMKKVVEKYVALTSSPYTKATLKDPSFIKAVREGRAGCEVGA
eukprot:TRINITY_DN23637_c0_g1_i1.p1 TRINITY_DN23637_c0_g1~~TRINITY_DN23637_c0_g1_i1.p1  ORF type:complete len:544 (-),score=86.23 TRINITY_DN23637_c0_g1_i1:200-1780(-)